MSPVVQINGAVTHNSWGKSGKTSAVARLLACGDINEDERYAELWMGVYPHKAQSTLLDGELLSEYIEKNPSALGQKVLDRFGALPFLFKVLSIDKALAVQIHPNKEQAMKLHQDMPGIYKDHNHKPEIAIALTDMEALCGFRPIKEILHFLDVVPELAAIIGEDLIKELEDEYSVKGNKASSALKQCFSKLLLCDKDKVAEKLKSLNGRLQELKQNRSDITSLNGKLFMKLYSQYPGDVGCFVMFFLNHVVMEPGEAIYIEATVPHAYVSGDLIECMANSDNVIRAGFTRNFVDVKTFCETACYYSDSEKHFRSTPTVTEDPFETIYNPPVDDFAVIRLKMPARTSNYSLRKRDCASILLLVCGEAIEVRSGVELGVGSKLFIPAHENIVITTSSDVLAYLAICIL